MASCTSVSWIKIRKPLYEVAYVLHCIFVSKANIQCLLVLCNTDIVCQVQTEQEVGII